MAVIFTPFVRRLPPSRSLSYLADPYLKGHVWHWHPVALRKALIPKLLVETSCPSVGVDHRQDDSRGVLCLGHNMHLCHQCSANAKPLRVRCDSKHAYLELVIASDFCIRRSWPADCHGANDVVPDHRDE
jgi:hypothetical protein